MERKKGMAIDRVREVSQGSWSSDVHLRNMGKGGDIIGRWQRCRALIRYIKLFISCFLGVTVAASFRTDSELLSGSEAAG